jgi:SAM-dependent methyltransferase
MFTEALRDRFHVHDTENVSAMGYDADMLAVIDEASANGGYTLDAGAGSKSQIFPNVVNLEIVDYESTDVLGVGQRLPFRDACFDAVLSIAVLEHVDDPFQCASELVRVLKPGGILFSAVPFLQPEHGYPEHYFNMTRSGLRRLFEGKGEVLRQFVPAACHPMYALHWFLQVYAASLPDQERHEFESLTVAEVLARPPEQWAHDSVGEALPEHARWILAAGSALILRK